MTSQDDRKLKEWAEGYAEQYGQTLLQEQRMLDEQRIAYATPRADARAKQLTKKSRRPRRAPFLAAAAALLLVFVGASAVWTLLDNPLGGSFAPSSSSSPDENSAASPADSIRALDFTLPAQFSVASVELDNGETIYHLDNSLHDDAVLTIREPAGDTGWMQGLDEITIDGTPVLAKLRDEYKLLTFESRGSLYTISCRDDIKTLSVLYRSVVESENKNV